VKTMMKKGLKDWICCSLPAKKLICLESKCLACTQISPGLCVLPSLFCLIHGQNSSARQEELAHFQVFFLGPKSSLSWCHSIWWPISRWRERERAKPLMITIGDQIEGREQVYMVSDL